MKIRLDENLPVRLAAPLKNLGHDVHTVYGERPLPRTRLQPRGERGRVCATTTQHFMVKRAKQTGPRPAMLAPAGEQNAFRLDPENPPPHSRTKPPEM